MLDKGIAYLGDDRWSATMGLSDINYEMAAQERQAQIIDQWARFINTFDGSTRLQVTCMTRTLDAGDVIGRIGMPMDGGPQDRLRADCNRIAMGKIGERSRNAVTDKYLTLTISEPEPTRPY